MVWRSSRGSFEMEKACGRRGEGWGCGCSCSCSVRMSLAREAGRVLSDILNKSDRYGRGSLDSARKDD
jgi:hypothetical protein